MRFNHTATLALSAAMTAVLGLSLPLNSNAGVVPGLHAVSSSSAAENNQPSPATPGNGETEAASEAAAGPGIQNNNTAQEPVQEELTSSSLVPGVLKESNAPADKDLDTIVAEAGLDALGEGNTPPDSILGQTPMFHYALRNAANQELARTASAFNTYLYHKDGFARFYLDHGGIGRYYCRVYTAARGWFPWQNSKESTPNDNDADKIQAIQIRVKGYTGVRDDIYYKVVLNDGTVLDWAKNGQTAGTIGTDKYIVAIKVALWYKENTFPEKTDHLMLAQNYEGTYLDENGQVQYSKADGSPYTGWGFLNHTQYYFKDGVRQSGWQYVDGYKYYLNEDGSVAKDLEPIMGLPGDYQIKYNKDTATMYVMAKDGANGYIIPYKTFMSSCGPDTPIGTFRIYAKYRWKFMHDDIYCQYLNRFKDGFIIHSLIYYDEPSSYALDPASYNQIDDAISGGCLRLRAGDAAWVFHNAPSGTPVIVYHDKWNKGPIEKDAIEQPIPLTNTYKDAADPTDPLIVQKRQQEEAAAQAAAAQAAEAERAAQEAAQSSAESAETQVESHPQN
ncbi:MAG: L,D-transpeptidase family protein [Johnsonella sp.]|nr:L,D-transpeptidase family protein [Johnsonella sp.]